MRKEGVAFKLEKRSTKAGTIQCSMLRRDADPAICRFHNRQAHNEPRVSRLGLDLDCSAELLRHDAMHNLQPQPRSRSLRLGGKEGLEDVRKRLRRNPVAVI